MNEFNPELLPSPEVHEKDRASFMDMFRSLLPDVEFDEPIEMLEARMIVLDALRMDEQNTDFVRAAFAEYANIREQFVDSKSPEKNDTTYIRAKLQIAVRVHKALIFREAGNIQRYGEELEDAEEYAFNLHLDEIAAAITSELDSLENEVVIS